MSLPVASRRFISSFSRHLRVAAVPRTASRPTTFAPAVSQRRTLFGFGKPGSAAEPSEEDVMARAKSITEALMQKEEWRKIATHAGAMQSMQNLLVILSKKGINVGSGQQPKFTDMMRLAADAEFREAVTTMKAQMKDAGVDLDDPELVKSLMSMATPPKP